jgi:hypothetical protein
MQTPIDNNLGVLSGAVSGPINPPYVGNKGTYTQMMDYNLTGGTGGSPSFRRKSAYGRYCCRSSLLWQAAVMERFNNGMRLGALGQTILITRNF